MVECLLKTRTYYAAVVSEVYGKEIIVMRTFLSVALAVLVGAVCLPSACDVIEFKNGDRVTGELQGCTPPTLRFRSALLGEHTIDIATIATLSCERSVTLLVKDAEPQTVTLLGITDATVSYRSGSGSEIDRPLESVVPIVPGEAPAPADQPVLPETTADQAEAAPEPKALWSGSVEAGVTGRKGNTDTLDARLGATAKRETEKTETEFTLSVDYGERSGSVTTNKALGKTRLRLYRTERSYWLGNVALEHDELRNIDLRAVLGLGAGRDFIATETTELSGDVGLAVTMEYFDEADYSDYEEAQVQLRRNALAALADPGSGSVAGAFALLRDSLLLRDLEPDDEDDNYDLSIQLGGKYSRKVFDTSTFEEALILYPSVSEFGTFRLTSDTSLTTPLRDHLSLRLSLRVDHDSDPSVAGVDDTDVSFITSLRYEFATSNANAAE